MEFVVNGVFQDFRKGNPPSYKIQTLQFTRPQNATYNYGFIDISLIVFGTSQKAATRLLKNRLRQCLSHVYIANIYQSLAYLTFVWRVIPLAGREVK